MNILIADDISLNRKVMRIKLTRINSSWTFTECASAEEAVLAAQDDNYQLIVMDEQFEPDHMTGTQAIEAIRANEMTQGIADSKKAVIVSWTASESLTCPLGADFTWPKDANAAMMQEAIERARARA